jgi:uncharacterized protein
MQEMKFKTSDIFECQQCGECCRGYGGTYVTEKDIKAIADFINVKEKEFIEEFCVKSGKKYLLGQKDDGFCHFLKDKICSIHPVKPKMCKAWPFIKAVVIEPFNWQIMASVCPGMRKDASSEVIKSIVLDKMK